MGSRNLMVKRLAVMSSKDRDALQGRVMALFRRARLRSVKKVRRDQVPPVASKPVTPRAIVAWPDGLGGKATVFVVADTDVEAEQIRLALEQLGLGKA